MNKIQFTKITSDHPKILSKEYSLDKDGELQRTTSAQMTKGHAEVKCVDSPKEFANVLKGLKTNQAITYGRPEKEQVEIITKAEWEKRGKPDNPIPRAKETFRFFKSPGVMFLDYDPGNMEKAKSQEELISMLYEVCPEIQNHTMVWWKSSSSNICHKDKDLTGTKGQRLYLFVLDASDIPRAAKVIVERLWAAGLGWFTVGKAGQKLKKTYFDTSVFQPNRLDFAAGAECQPPLEQRRGKPVIIHGKNNLLDTKKALPDNSNEIKARAKANEEKERKKVEDEARAQEEAYIEEKVKENTNDDDSQEVKERAREDVKRVLEHGVLSGSFPVYVCENGKTTRVTVTEILDNPDKYHGKQTLDPIEPEYDGKRPVGKLYLHQPSPQIFSFAHGGKNFSLSREIVWIHLTKGKTYDVVKKTCSVLRDEATFFDMGDALVTTEGGETIPMSEHLLKHSLGSRIQYFSLKKVEEKNIIKQPEDPKPDIPKQVLSIGRMRKLKPLKAAINNPTIRPDGTLLTQPGYDEKSQLLLDMKENAYVPENPTIEQCEKALEIMWYPFKDFPFCSQLDKTALIQSALTVITRPSLPTCPGILIEAPTPGSGKTRIASCLSVLSNGKEPVTCNLSTKNDEEMRKAMFTYLLGGQKSILLDNLTGVLDSPSLAAILTSSTYQDRILGKTESVEVPNKAVLILTGNNLTLAGDLPRRILPIRIDPATEKAYAREFDLDPVAYVNANRLRIAECGLTLIRGMFTHMKEKKKGRMASFEIWDDLVRQTICWLNDASDNLVTGPLEDPMKIVDKSYAEDPVLEILKEFLTKWRDVFKNRAVTAKEILKEMCETSTNNGHDLYNAYLELAARQQLRSAKSLGWDLRKFKDRIVDNLVLRQDVETKTSKWRVFVVNDKPH